jgi:hypothetical protein
MYIQIEWSVLLYLDVIEVLIEWSVNFTKAFCVTLYTISTWSSNLLNVFADTCAWARSHHESIT